MVKPDQMLVFDMDGVLVDVSESYRGAIVETVRHFTGKQISAEMVQDYKNAGGWNNDWALSQKIAADLGVPVDYETVVEHFNKIFLGNGTDGLIARERWIPRPGLLESLAERYRLAIFTGRLQCEAGITLRRFASELRFARIICSDDVANGKPAPDGLLQIAGEFPGCCLWYVGDTVDDARSARAANVKFIGIAAPASPRREELAALLAQENAVAVLDDINTLETVLV